MNRRRPICDYLCSRANAQTFQGHCATVTSKAQVRRLPWSAFSRSLVIRAVCSCAAPVWSVCRLFWDRQRGALWCFTLRRT